MLDRIHRIWWQVTGALLFNFPFIGRMNFPWLPVPVLNCYACPLAQGACPVGTWQHFLVIGAIPFFAIGVVALYSGVAGRFFCSHLCPFGFFQDLLARIRNHHILLPRWVSYGKYVSLVVLSIILPLILLEPFFCTLCPAGTIEAGIPLVSGSWYTANFGEQSVFSANVGVHTLIGWWYWFKVGILVVMIWAAVMIRRPFCRMACPLGASLGLANRFTLFVHPPASIPGERQHFNLKTCPVHITNPRDIDSHACIKCRQCYPKPPKAGAETA